MEPLDVDTLARLDSVQGLDLSSEELAALLPLVQAARALMAPLRDVPLGDAEPAGQYRIV